MTISVPLSTTCEEALLREYWRSSGKLSCHSKAANIPNGDPPLLRDFDQAVIREEQLEGAAGRLVDLAKYCLRGNVDDDATSAKESLQVTFASHHWTNLAIVQINVWKAFFANVQFSGRTRLDSIEKQDLQVKTRMAIMMNTLKGQADVQLIFPEIM